MAKVKTSKKFQDWYKRLNREQKLAVDTVEGPVMVVAGPGTGKTQVLTLRIANILRETDTSPDSILALTFTESGAYSMRKRLVEIMGPQAYRLKIFTFHGFANDIIKNYPEEFQTLVGASNINIIDQIKILESIINKTKLTKLIPFGNPHYYVRPVLTTISKLKRENISPKKLGTLLVKEKESDLKNQELLLLYKEYQKALKEGHLYDYDDMIMEVITVLKKNTNLLRELQEQFQFILADEHQDTNGAQNELLELLCNYYDNPNLFIVGDEKQAIFRFQGASLENFNYFKERFRGVKLINLKTNYRSGQGILSAAESLIPSDTPLVSGVTLAQARVSIYPFSRGDVELAYLLGDIEKKIKSGISPEEIAILYRDNKDALPIIHSFEKAKVPFVIESDQDILNDIDIRKIILVFRAILDVGDQDLFKKVLHIDFLNIESLEIYKYSKTGQSSKKIEAFSRRLAAWYKTSYNKDLIEFFEIVVRESGFLDYIIALPDAVDKMEKLSTLFEELKVLVENHRSYGLKEFLEYIDLIEEHKILLKNSSKESLMGSVHLMTAHKSKGQEFDWVYVVGACDGHWGHRRVKRDFILPSLLGLARDEDDERRLFYVALTRAKKGVNISYARESADGRKQLASQFIEEMDPKHIKTVDTKNLEKDLKKEGKRTLWFYYQQ